MQTENSIVSDLKNTFNTGGMTIKLIFVNVIVFVFIAITEVIGRLLGGNLGASIQTIVESIFSLNVPIKEFIIKPWGLFTYAFTHYNFLHLFFNMLFLFGIGRIFEQFFSAKRLLYTYILGGVLGGLLEILAQLIIPGYGGTHVVGASGSVLAILVATAFYKPQLNISIFGLFNMRLIFIALIYILSNVYNFLMGTESSIAYMAHLGGALLGYISVQNSFAHTNIINRAMRLGDSITGLFKSKKTKNGNFRYSKSEGGRHFKSDEEYNMDAKSRQQQIDAILDKISRSGYESLTKGEKELLFKQSGKN